MSTLNPSNRSRRSRVAIFFIICALNLHGLTHSHSLKAQTQALSPSLTPTTLNAPERVQHYQQLVSPERLASHLYLLASDLFEGRETTTRGQKLAAQYLATQYHFMGLAPKGTLRTVAPNSPEAYFQPFNVYRTTPEETHLELSLKGKQVAVSTFSARTHDDLSFFLTGDVKDATGGVVFAGYGIADDKLGYNDYAALAAKGISIDGKWVMILDAEPMASATTSLLPTEGHQLSKWTTNISKRLAILAAGKPAGILEVRLPGPLLKGSFAELAATASQNAKRVGGLSLFPNRDFPPTYSISGKLADQILAASGQKIENLRQQIDRSLKPAVFEITGATIKATTHRSPPAATENVLAFIEGSDPKLKQEVVVVSAHYDHLGLNPALKGDQIFNGAADDGSGVVACLEMAQALMTARRDGYGPRRSVLFINFSAEEKGTLGSSFYTNHEPVVPLDQTVADINMDGVAGIDAKHPTNSRNYVYVIGTEELSGEMIDTNKRVREATGIELELTLGRNFPSDQRNFQGQLVPFLYYSTGLTEHYHTIADEAKTIDYEHLARVVRLVLGTVWQVANQDVRPRSVDRRQLSIVGYVCPPCGFECDETVYQHGGVCPACGMALVPKFQVNGTNGK